MDKINDDDRITFATLADYLIPEYGNKPTATAVGVHQDLLDKVLAVRPDLSTDFLRGVRFAAGKDISEALNSLNKEDRVAFDAITLVASGGYLMSETVREAMGYPGQEPAPYDPQETPEYMTNGMLERVTLRGPIYRPTPRDED